MITIFSDVLVFDGLESELIGPAHVVVEGQRIREVSLQRPAFRDAVVLNCSGHYLMPGLIDAHFHAYSPSFDIAGGDRMPPALMVSHARKILEGALERGFTSVRDAAGGDIGLAMAIEQGLIGGPRFFFAGKALSQTGGHGDARRGDQVELCGCSSYSGLLSRVVDGPDAMRSAVREELRKGAHQIKLFVSGGVLSPTDPLWMPQLSNEEIRAAVEESATRRTYVMAHCHTDEGARRCVELGVRSVEHGTLIRNRPTAEFIASRGAFVVPTLSVIEVLHSHGPALKLPLEASAKVQSIGEEAYHAIEVCRAAGVKLGLGTDLFGHAFHPLQAGELELRGRVEKAIDVLRSATSVNAELLQKSGELGQIAAGAYADLLVLNKNPLRDLTVFGDPGNIPVIMKGGAFVRNALASRTSGR